MPRRSNFDPDERFTAPEGVTGEDVIDTVLSGAGAEPEDFEEPDDELGGEG